MASRNPRTYWLPLAALLAVHLVGCGQPQVPTDVDRESIGATDRDQPTAEWKDTASALLDENKTDEAVALLDDVIAADAANSEALLLRAEAKLYRGELDASLADCEAVLLLDSKSAEAWHSSRLLKNSASSVILSPINWRGVV